MNSIRFQKKASRPKRGEAREPHLVEKTEKQRQTLMLAARAWEETSGMVGDRMVGSWSDVKWGSRSGNSDGVHGAARARSEEPSPEGDRASVGAKKRGNARGAKGGRDVADIEGDRGPKTGVVPCKGLKRARIQDRLRKRSGVWFGDARRRTPTALSAESSSRNPTATRKSEVGPSPGKPDARNSPVRFGRGGGPIPPLPHQAGVSAGWCRTGYGRSDAFGEPPAIGLLLS